MQSGSFFFGLFVFIPLIWFLPWWSLIILSAVVGFFRRGRWRSDLLFSLSGGVVFAALAFVRDGQQYGQISQRLSAMMELPPGGIFLVMIAMGFLTIFIWLRTGQFFKSLFKETTT